MLIDRIHSPRTMSLKLYEMRHSPFCIPIVCALEAAGVAFDRIEVPNWDRRLVIELTGGDYYQVPVLVHEGQVIFEPGADTQNVPRYVDQAFCSGRLFPARHEGLQQILIHYLENDVEGVTFRLADIHYVPAIEDIVNRTMVVRHKERKFGRGCIEAWRDNADHWRAEAETHFGRFDLMLQNHPFLLGAEPVFSDFLLCGIIGNYTFNGWNTLPSRFAALSAWRERMERLRWQ